MRIPFLVLLLAETYSLASTSCPASCIVCSEDAIICHTLSTIIGVPDTAQALMVTNGWIDHVDHTTLSSIGNISVLALSNNAIATIHEDAFQNLTELRTLLLDHNRISSEALRSSTLSWLPKLETLQLGNNILQEINGYWFQNSGKLKVLQLESNMLSTLNSSTFSMSDLSSLETLDLSENFITHVGQDSFRNLPQLRMLDLSRNRLENIIPNVFSSLPWLSDLNLDLNSWKCSCELLDLASFLNSYIQRPNKVLYNGQNMTCVSADNPAVQAVLQLSEANCAPTNRHNPVNGKTRRDITAKQYTRDITLASVLFFAGGVAVTCIAHKLILQKSSRALQKGSEDDELKHSSPRSVKRNITEVKEALSEMPSVDHLCVNCGKHTHQPVLDREMPAIPNHDSAVEPYFTCQSCASAVLSPSLGHRGNNQRSETILHLEENKTTAAHKWPVSEERLLRSQSMLRDLFFHRQMQGPPYGQNGQIKNPSILYHGNMRQDTSVRQDGPLSNHGKWSSKSLSDATIRSHGQTLSTISCIHCHKTFEHKQAWNASNSPKEFRAMRQKETLNYSQSGSPRQAKKHGRKTGFHRNVTFDLTESAMHAIDMHDVRYRGKSLKYCHKLDLNHVSAKSIKANVFERHLSSQSCKIHCRKSLKVKLNLNPLKKCMVHPNSSPRHNKHNTKNLKKKDKHKLKARSTRDKDVESPNKSIQGKKSKTSKNSVKECTKKSSQLNLDADTEGTVCDSTNQENHTQQVESAGCPKTEEASEAESSFISPSNPSSSDQLPLGQPHAAVETLNEDGSFTGDSIMSSGVSKAPAVVQEYLYSPEGSPKRKIRLIMPEKTTNRPTSALDKKIR